MGVLVTQLFVMFFLMFIGFGLFRAKKLTAQGSKELGNVLVYVIMPCVVFNAYMTEFSVKRLWGLLAAFGLSIAALGISMAISALIFHRHPIENFGTAFSNAGFMGLPLIQAVLGSEAVFYASAFVALLNFLQWTYGVFIITGERRQINAKKILLNPIIISLFLGIIVFLMRIEIPEVLSKTVSLISGMNAPVAMISIGTYLAQISLKNIVADKTVWLSCLFRLFIIPGICAAILWILPGGYAEIKLAVLITSAAPVGSNVAIFAQLYHKNYTQAVKSVCLSSVLSLISIPLIISMVKF